MKDRKKLVLEILEELRKETITRQIVNHANIEMGGLDDEKKQEVETALVQLEKEESFFEDKIKEYEKGN